MWDIIQSSIIRITLTSFLFSFPFPFLFRWDPHVRGPPEKQKMKRKWHWYFSLLTVSTTSLLSFYCFLSYILVNISLTQKFIVLLPANQKYCIHGKQSPYICGMETWSLLWAYHRIALLVNEQGQLVHAHLLSALQQTNHQNLRMWAFNIKQTCWAAL